MKSLFRVLLVIAVFVVAACTRPPAFVSTDITGVDWGKGFALPDTSDQPRQLTDFKGKVVVLFFGYTQCPDVCPTTLSAMREVLLRLGDAAASVQVIFVTLDPARDTRSVLAAYVTAFHPSFIALRGDEAATAAAAKEFKVFYVQQPGPTPGSYGIDHSTGSYAFDPQGRLRLLIRHGERTEAIVEDLKLLLAGK